jgi:Icc-related predicted phosphoesterase
MKWTKQLESLFKQEQIHNDVRNEGQVYQEDNLKSHGKKLPIEFNLRMLIIADTHGCLRPEEIPDNIDANVCLLLGDIYQNDMALIKEAVVGIPIYGVLGNHDGFELYDMYGIDNIHGKVVEVNGVKIAGIQGSLRYKNSFAPLYDDDESVEIADCMEAANILISHDGPKFFHGDRDFAHSGLEGITHYCQKHNVPLNIHGHHHENMSGALENGTKSICCYGVKVIDTQDF